MKDTFRTKFQIINPFFPYNFFFHLRRMWYAVVMWWCVVNLVQEAPTCVEILNGHHPNTKNNRKSIMRNASHWLGDRPVVHGVCKKWIFHLFHLRIPISVVASRIVYSSKQDFRALFIAFSYAFEVPSFDMLTIDSNSCTVEFHSI